MNLSRLRVRHMKAIFVLIALAQATTFAQQTICYLTLNSTEERELFKKYYPQAEHIELAIKPEDTNTNWFENACAQKISCDKLVVSAHFGGTFFGSSGLSIKIQDLEKHACRKTCDNLLKDPSEVYLFGCNTLAGKEADHRTPDVYIQVLIDDGFSREEATRVAAARYSPIGNSFARKMENIFTGPSAIFGFTSVGPSGANVSPKLEAYLTSQNPNRFEAWHKSMSYTYRASTKSNPEPDQTLCAFMDDRSLLEKLQLTRDVLNSNQRWDYIFTIEEALSEVSLFDFNSEELNTWKEISQNTNLQAEYKKLLPQLEDVPVYKVALMKLATKFEWSDKNDLNSYVTNLFSKYLDKGFDQSAVDTLCSLDVLVPIQLTSLNLSDSNISNITKALVCLGPQHTALLNTIFDYLIDRPYLMTASSWTSSYYSALKLASLSENYRSSITKIAILSLSEESHKELAAVVLSKSKIQDKNLQVRLLGLLDMICSERTKNINFLSSFQSTSHAYSSIYMHNIFRAIMNFADESHHKYILDSYRLNPSCQITESLVKTLKLTP